MSFVNREFLHGQPGPGGVSMGTLGIDMPPRPTTSSVLAVPNGSLYATRIANLVRVSNVQFEVTTALASSNAQLAYYADNNGVGGARLGLSDVISCGTAGVRTSTFSPPIPPGVWWIGFQNITAVGPFSVRSATHGWNPSMPGCDFTGGTNMKNALSWGAQGTVPPTSLPAGGTSSAGIVLSLRGS